MTQEVITEPKAEPAGPLALISRAIDRDMGAEEVGKLVDLYRAMEKDKASAAFFAAMARCQAEMPVVVKDAENSQTRSRYALIETIFNRTKGIAHKHGFSFSWTEGPIPAEGLRNIILRVRHEAGHMEEINGNYQMDGIGPKGNPTMNPVQAGVSTHSYAQRDLWRLYWSITIAGEDQDGNTNEPLSEAEVSHIKQLLRERAVDYDKFLAWACDGMPKEEHAVENMPKKMYGPAVNFLKKKPAKDVKHG